MKSIGKLTRDIQHAERAISDLEAQLKHLQADLAAAQNAKDQAEHEVEMERARWATAVNGAAKKGWRAVAWTPDETAVMLGLHPIRVNDIIYSAVWCHNIESMDGWGYDGQVGQVSYPVAYFRKKSVRREVAEAYDGLLHVNFRRMLRGEEQLTFEEAMALDRRQGTKWRQK